MQAQACQNMEEVRIEIDKINTDILKLLAARQNYVERAAALKTNSADIPAPNRRQEIMANVQTQATALGLDHNVAQAVFTSMIDAFIAFEHEKHLSK